MAEGKRWSWERVTLLIVGLVLGLIIIIASVSYYFLSSVDNAKARLFVEEGSVLVNGKEAKEIIKLKQGDGIETEEDGLASVVLYDSVIINLEQNTKISLNGLARTHPVVEQFKGTTGNKFTKLFGVEDYTIKSGTTWASVRGTEFSFGDEKIYTAEGKVEVTFLGEKYTVEENKVVEVVNGKIREREANSYEKKATEWQRERIIKNLERIRDNELERHFVMMNIIKKKYSITEEKIKESIKDVDEGKYDVDSLVKKSPVETGSITKLAELTKKIQQLKKEGREVVVAKQEVRLVEPVEEDTKFVVSEEKIKQDQKPIIIAPEMVQIDKEIREEEPVMQDADIKPLITGNLIKEPLQ